MSLYFMPTLTDSNKKRLNYHVTEMKSVKELVKNYENHLKRVNTISSFDFSSKEHPRAKFLDKKPKKFLKKYEYVVNELINTERTYIDQLKMGIDSYGKIFYEPDLPNSLKGKKDILFTCLECVVEFHDKTFYSILEENSGHIEKLLCSISEQITDNNFYCYVTHAFAKRISLDLIGNFKDYFAKYSSKIQEPFGIECLILCPLRRILKYHLIFENLLKVLETSDELDLKTNKLCFTVIKQFKKINDIINAAEEINRINNFVFIASYDYGHFLKADNFKITESISKKYCKGRLFLFEKCVICTEVLVDGSLNYWKYFSYDKIGISINTSKGFKIFYSLANDNSLDLVAEDDAIENEWVAKILGMINCFVAEEKHRLKCLSNKKP